MSYTQADYLKEEKERLDKLFPPIKEKKQTTAKKQHFCDHPDCDNNEIHPGELVWWYKPKPTYSKTTKKKTYHKWRTRCMNHEPMSYEEFKQIKAKEAI